jgi:hypothetical protein
MCSSTTASPGSTSPCRSLRSTRSAFRYAEPRRRCPAMAAGSATSWSKPRVESLERSGSVCLGARSADGNDRAGQRFPGRRAGGSRRGRRRTSPTTDASLPSAVIPVILGSIPTSRPTVACTFVTWSTTAPHSSLGVPASAASARSPSPTMAATWPSRRGAPTSLPTTPTVLGTSSSGPIRRPSFGPLTRRWCPTARQRR